MHDSLGSEAGGICVLGRSSIKKLNVAKGSCLKNFRQVKWSWLSAIVFLISAFFQVAAAQAVVEPVATASSGNNPMAVLDGDDDTLWIVHGPDPQEITVDFGFPISIRSVELEWGKTVPAEYEVGVSTDGNRWTTVVHVEGFNLPSKRKGLFLLDFTTHKLEATQTARFFRLSYLKFNGGSVELSGIRINGNHPFCYEPVPADALCLNKSASPAERTQDLLSRMTLREKIGMTGGFNFFFFSGLERFGFAPVLLHDASAGLNLRPNVERENSSLTKSTSFPLGVALAATWQPELAFAEGKSIGEEGRAAGTGILLGPGVNIHRTSTGGRNFEYMSEDPYLTSRMAVEYIKGVQSQGIIATVKHFVANNHEFLRHNSNALIDERTMNEIYLPAFAAAVQEGQVKAVMSSFNWLDGEKVGNSKLWLTDILRGQLGYTGMVMSDWGGTHHMDQILESGQNVMMPNMRTFGQLVLAEWKKDPVVTEAKLDKMIAPTLSVLFEMGTWDRKPAADPAFNATLPGHIEVAQTIAESAITLLKNDQVLPLVKGQSILVTGSSLTITNSSTGLGSAKVDGYDPVNFLDGLKAVFGDQVSYAEKPSDEAIRKADRILYFFKMEDSEARDRPIDLRESRDIQSLASKNPNVIVIASSGTAFEAPWLASVKGLVHGYFLGQRYGAAMANVLSGKVNPSGKLPFTMEKVYSDSPAYGYNFVDGKPYWKQKRPPAVTNLLVDIPYAEGVFVGYRWYEARQKPVNFPFGFGLSYTAFEITELTVSSPVITHTEPITVTVTVKNTGKRAGAEVVQLYVHDEAASVERPYRELKGFRKVFLQPGESKTVTLPLDWKALAFWDVKTHSWLAEPGEFILLVGNSSQNMQQQARITYKN